MTEEEEFGRALSAEEYAIVERFGLHKRPLLEHVRGGFPVVLGLAVFVAVLVVLVVFLP